MPDLFEVLKSRRSVRAYSDEPVGEEELRELVELAVLAPTAMNLQPWRFSIITNRQVLAEVSDRVKALMLEQGIADQIKEKHLEAMLKSEEYNIFYNAPAVIVISARKENPGAQIDCQLAAENLFLAAHAKGLGTCYMGFVFFGNGDAKVRAGLAVAEGYDIMAACTVGWPKSMPQGPPARRPPEIEWVR